MSDTKKSLIKKTTYKSPEITIKAPNLNIPSLDVNELQKRLKDKIHGFPTISFTIYLIFAISTFILIGYLLTLNSNSDPNSQNKIIIWGLFIASIIVFIINRILFFFDFDFKTITLAIIMIIQTGLTASALIAARNYGHIGNNYTDLYNVAQAMNILTTALGLVPLYYNS